MTTNTNIYRQELIEEAKEPQLYGQLDQPDVSVTHGNRSCGDIVTVDLIFNRSADGEIKIAELRWRGEGCVLSKAAASLMAAAVVSRSIEDVAKLSIADVERELGVENLSLGRQKCALVGLQAIQLAVRDIKSIDETRQTCPS